MYIITQEMKNKIQEMDKKNFKQWDYLKKAIPRIVHWSKKNNCKTKKITDLTKKEFIAILEEIGYTTEFNNNIRINFDSDENVQKNYQGTIIYMSLYTVVFRYCEK